jgi:hypothetical protein
MRLPVAAKIAFATAGPTAAVAASPMAVDGGDAGSRRRAIDMHGAGATPRSAAAEFGTGHAEHVAQHPEQGRVAVDIDTVRRSVDFDRKCHGVLRWLLRPAGYRSNVASVFAVKIRIVGTTISSEIFPLLS